jgi:hypothetical protein
LLDRYHLYPLETQLRRVGLTEQETHVTRCRRKGNSVGEAGHNDQSGRLGAIVALQAKRVNRNPADRRTQQDGKKPLKT